MRAPRRIIGTMVETGRADPARYDRVFTIAPNHFSRIESKGVVQ